LLAESDGAGDGEDDAHHVVDGQPYDVRRLMAHLPGETGACTILWLHCIAKEQALLDRKSTRLNSSPCNLVCRLLLEKKKKTKQPTVGVRGSAGRRHARGRPGGVAACVHFPAGRSVHAESARANTRALG